MSIARWSPWVVALGVGLAACSAQLPPSAPHDLLGKSGEVRREPSLAGELIELPTPGSVTVIDFWGTSCKPCVKSMPALEALYRDRKGDGLQVIGVAVDDNPGLVVNKLAELGVDYPNVLDDLSSTLRGSYLVTDVPMSFVFDRTGKLRLVVGGESEDMIGTVRQAVDYLLEEAP